MADNIFSDLTRMIDQVGKDKGIDKKIIIEAIENAMETAARKKFGLNKEIEAQFNEETGEMEIYEFKNVVDEIDLIDNDILVEDAQKLDPDVQVGDSLGIKLDASQLGRIAAQTAKQIIMGRVRDAERDLIYSEFQERKGEIASGIARRVEKGAIVVDLGRTEAYLPQREQIPGELFKPGDRIQGYIADVRQTTRGPQIVMSRADERYLMKLFEIEVPEIYDGIVEIKAAAREPGSRAKIAVLSKDSTIDPVGACVGMKGSRVQNVVQELKGEKIDIVLWNEDPTRFVCNALAPAEVSKVIIDEGAKEMEIVVPDSQLSLAIGKKGQNVRLAAKLTGWKLDILSETKIQAKQQEAIFNLMLIPQMSETLAHGIYQNGFSSIDEIIQAEVSELLVIPGFDQDKAQRLKDQAAAVVADYAARGEALPQSEAAAVAKSVGNDAKALAEARLKMELSWTSQKKGDVVQDASELLKVRGISETTAEHLKAVGVYTVEALATKTLEELTAIQGIGETKAKQIKTEVENFLNSKSAPTE